MLIGEPVVRCIRWGFGRFVHSSICPARSIPTHLKCQRVNSFKPISNVQRSLSRWGVHILLRFARSSGTFCCTCLMLEWCMPISQHRHRYIHNSPLSPRSIAHKTEPANHPATSRASTMDVKQVPDTTSIREQSKAGGEQQPGIEHCMEPKPHIIRDNYKGGCLAVVHMVIDGKKRVHRFQRLKLFGRSIPTHAQAPTSSRATSSSSQAPTAGLGAPWRSTTRGRGRPLSPSAT